MNLKDKSRQELDALHKKHHKILLAIIDEQRQRDYNTHNEDALIAQVEREANLNRWFETRGLESKTPTPLNCEAIKGIESRVI